MRARTESVDRELRVVLDGRLARVSHGWVLHEKFSKCPDFWRRAAMTFTGLFGIDEVCFCMSVWSHDYVQLSRASKSGIQKACQRVQKGTRESDRKFGGAAPRRGEVDTRRSSSGPGPEPNQRPHETPSAELSVPSRVCQTGSKVLDGR